MYGANNYYVTTNRHETSRGLSATAGLRVSQPSQIHALPDGGNRFCNPLISHSSRASQTDGRTDGRKIDLNSGAYYVTLAKHKSGECGLDRLDTKEG